MCAQKIFSQTTLRRKKKRNKLSFIADLKRFCSLFYAFWGFKLQLRLMISERIRKSFKTTFLWHDNRSWTRFVSHCEAFATVWNFIELEPNFEVSKLNLIFEKFVKIFKRHFFEHETFTLSNQLKGCQNLTLYKVLKHWKLISSSFLLAFKCCHQIQ